MKEEDMVELLRHYRHDWMNQIQLIMGYASMGKLDKVKAKLDDFVAEAENERKLQNLNMPKTIIWLMSFNWRYDNFRINYQVDLEDTTIPINDDKIHTRLNKMMGILIDHSSKMELYNGEFTLKKQLETGNVQIFVSFQGDFQNVDNLQQLLLEDQAIQEVKIEQLANANYQCTITWISS